MDKETIKYYEMSAQSYLDKAVKADFNELSDINLYDGVWANFSLLHAPRSEMLPNLIRIHRALKKKGYLHLGLKI